MWIYIYICMYVCIYIKDVHYIMNKMKRTQLAAELSPKCGTKNYIYISIPLAQGSSCSAGHQRCEATKEYHRRGWRHAFPRLKKGRRAFQTSAAANRLQWFWSWKNAQLFSWTWKSCQTHFSCYLCATLLLNVEPEVEHWKFFWVPQNHWFSQETWRRVFYDFQMTPF